MADLYNSTGLEEFSQTRPTDGLFDDEIVPISAEPQGTDESPAEVLSAGPDAAADLEGHRHADQERTRQEKSGAEKEVDELAASATKENDQKEDVEQRPETRDSATPPRETATDESRKERREVKSAAQRVRAILGDQGGSGSIRKSRLTEEELAERLAAAKLNAAKVAAAHARAEADEASFQEREKIATEKRRQESLNRKAMEEERERNRQRKLNAQKQREWDADKRSREDSRRGRRGGGGRYHRGMHGGVSGPSRRHKKVETTETGGDTSGPPEQEQQEREASRDRKSSAVDSSELQASPKINDEGQNGEAVAKVFTGDTEQSPQAADQDPVSPAGETWADQVESASK